VVEDAQLGLIEYLGSLLPGRDSEDLLTALAVTAAAPAPLAATVLATGYETLLAGIANAALTLLTAGPGFGSWPTSSVDVRRLVDELLRYSPLGGTMRSRCALVDVVVGEVLVGKGEVVLAATGPANRDPLRFDEPERFCPGRRDNRHVAFGVGERFCIGSQLAVMGLTVALERIALRYPRVRLAVADVTVLEGSAEPRPTELLVRWPG
jgi:cytochrome P450